MVFTDLISLAARLFEGTGVLAMVLGAVVALLQAATRRPRESLEAIFHHFRNRMGQAILLGLELLVAADIIRTVSERPTLQGVLVLGLIVLIRTFLSFTLVVELEGFWPWQRARLEHREGGPPTPRPPPG
jgi:uncharacterized membrane protein